VAASRARFFIERALQGAGLRVEVQAAEQASRALKPLADFLRAQPLWSGGAGYLIVEIADPATVSEAFRPGTPISSWRDVEALAGVQWTPPSEFRGGELRQLEWIAIMRERLEQHLQRLARQHPGLPFPGFDYS